MDCSSEGTSHQAWHSRLKKDFERRTVRGTRCRMIGLLFFVLAVLASPFKSKLRPEVENAVLRQQLIVLRRRLPGRVRLTNHDRWFFVQLYRWFPSILQVLTIIRPETVVRWHRAGFRCY